jgi:hypothetical protein
MQRLHLGLFVLATAWLASCSDDPDPRRFMPTGVVAAAGSSGTSGGGGSGGATGSGTGGGNTGGMAAGAAPTTFPPPPCTGCIEMDVPVAPGAASLIAMFNFVFPAPGVDMSNATVTFRVSSLSVGADLYVTPFAQNGAALNYAGVYRPQTVLTATNGFTGTGMDWVNVVLDLANTAPLVAEDAGAPPAVADAGDAGGSAGGLLPNGGMDKGTIEQLGLQIGALASIPAATTIRVLVDSVTFDGIPAGVMLVRNRDFSDGVQDLAQNDYMVPPGTTGPTKY